MKREAGDPRNHLPHLNLSHLLRKGGQVRPASICPGLSGRKSFCHCVEFVISLCLCDEFSSVGSPEGYTVLTQEETVLSR